MLIHFATFIAKNLMRIVNRPYPYAEVSQMKNHSPKEPSAESVMVLLTRLNEATRGVSGSWERVSEGLEGRFTVEAGGLCEDLKISLSWEDVFLSRFRVRLSAGLSQRYQGQISPQHRGFIGSMKSLFGAEPEIEEALNIFRTNRAAHLFLLSQQELLEELKSFSLELAMGSGAFTLNAKVESGVLLEFIKRVMTLHHRALLFGDENFSAP